MKAVRQYFQTGQLPSSDTVCEVDELPFQVDSGAYKAESALSAEDNILKAAIRELSRKSIVHINPVV